MLIPKKYVIEATTLTREGVVKALNAAGYGDNEGIISAEFLGMNETASFVYKITYPDEGGPSTGNIFVRILPHHAGKNGEYVLVADF